MKFIAHAHDFCPANKFASYTPEWVCVYCTEWVCVYCVYCTYSHLWFHTPTEEKDFLPFNTSVTLNGTYSVGHSECVALNITAVEDNIVEDTETFLIVSGSSSGPELVFFIIDNDCKYQVN